MSQAGYTPISLYYSTTAAAVPTSGNLANGELAINITDEKLYFKNAAGTVKLLASNATSAPVLSFSAGTTGFTPSTATTGVVTLAGTLATTNGGTGLTVFTANQVFYASSTSAFAQSANMTFNGTTLTVTDITDSSLTAGLVTFAGTAGNLTNSNNFSWNGTGLGLGVSGGAYLLDVRSGATANSAAFTSTSTTAYTPSAVNNTKARLLLSGGNATSSTIGITFTAGGANENYFGTVQQSDGTGAFVFQGYNGTAYAERAKLDQLSRLAVGPSTVLAGRINSIEDTYSCFTAQSSTAGAGQNVRSLVTTDLGAANFANAIYDAISHTWQASSSSKMSLTSAGALLVGTSTNDFASYGAISQFRVDQNSPSLLTISNQNAGSSGSAGTLFSAYGNSWVNSIGTAAKDGNALTWAVDATASPPSVKMTLTTGGNFGLGNFTPYSTWGGSYVAFQIQSVARTLAATGAGAGDLTLAFNAVYDSTDSRWEFAGTGDKAGRYSQTGNGDHIFYVTATNGVAGNPITFNQAVTIDNAGNLCVGSTSAGNAGTINVSVGNPGTTVGGLQLWSTTSATHYVHFGDSASGGDPYRGYVGYAHASDAMVFGTASTQRMQLDATNGLQIGTSAGNAGANGLHVTGAIYQGASGIGQAQIVISGGNSIQAQTLGVGYETLRLNPLGSNVRVGGAGSSNYKFLISDSAGVRTQSDAQFSIDGSGYAAFHFLDNTGYYIGQNSTIRDVRVYSGSNTAIGVVLGAGATSWSSYSDERMKDIIEPIENALEKVLTLRTVIGKYKIDETNKRRAMMIAQDVKAVLPEATTEDANGMLTMAYDNIIPLLVAAVKELKTEFDAYKASHP